MTTKPEIRIVQYHWGEQNRSYQITRKINEAYCRRHGYEYILKTFLPREDRAWCWSKIPAMREELHDCDYLLYLDADAFFYNHELTVERELIPRMEDKKIMMSVNCDSEELRHQPDKPNSGVILVQNSDKTAEILRVWDESSERPGLEEFRFDHCREQDACCMTVWQEYAKDVKLLENYYLMNGLFGIFIRHLMNTEDEERIRILNEFLERHKEVIQI
jgi:hypothetical protein